MNSALSARLVKANRPLILQPVFRSAFGVQSARQHHFLSNQRARPTTFGQYPTFSILQSYRSLSTETTTPSTGTPIPPPGFNVNEAKKPLPVERNVVKPPNTVSPIAVKEVKENSGAVKTTGSEPPSESQTLAPAAAEEKSVGEVKPAEKLTLWQKVKREANHYWDGTKLLGVEIKISWRLALKMASGYELTRREHRQLQRTIKDLGRLIPFSVFIIVPAGELFLPFALKLFPNLLPSTYEGATAKEKKLKALRNTRKSVSDFLRTTLQEGGLPLSKATRQRDEFIQFFKKIRATGESPNREELIRVCKTFKDDVTLDNLSRPQLVAMCRYMNLSSFGTDGILRYNIRHRMRQIKQDDRVISYEGIDSLTVPELQNACASRGIRSHGVSPARLREDLATWLELRLKHGVPSTLLILSNAFMYAQGKEGEMDSHYDALQAVLSAIPEELYHEMELDLSAAEGAATNKQRLEVLREQQELIEQEAAEGSAEPAIKDDQDIEDKEKAPEALTEAKENADAEGKAKQDTK